MDDRRSPDDSISLGVESIDRALSQEETIEVSPGFQHRVMRRVRAHDELPPLAFAWRRFAAGVVLAVGAVGASMAVGEDATIATPNPASVVVVGVLVAVAARLTAGLGERLLSATRR